MKLSIITINYNNKDGLQKTIDSVICQTWSDYEWIVVDGGSTDGSKELIEKYKDYFAYWCSEPDKGIYNAQNKGISYACGDYISCMNSGDTFYEEDTLKRVFSVERKGDVLYGDYMGIYQDHTCLIHFPSPLAIHHLYRWSICHQAMFVRASILKQKGFDESYKIYADKCRWIEAAMDGSTFEFLGFTVCRFDMNGISQTNVVLKREEQERIRKEKFPPSVLLTCQQLIEYEESDTIQKVKWLLRKGKLVRGLAKSVVASLAWIDKKASSIKRGKHSTSI